MSGNGYVYIIYSKNWDKYYVGSTDDLDRRLDAHNRGQTKSTRSAEDWHLKFSMEYKTLQDARRKENYLKSLKSRRILEQLIQRDQEIIRKYMMD